MLDPNVVGLFAYVGPGPGIEFIPYFFSLLTWIGLAFGAVLLWPISAVLRRFRCRNDPVPSACEAPSWDDG